MSETCYGRVFIKIGVAGEYCKVTGGLLWKGKALSGNKQNLGGELCVVVEELSDLRCLTNTLTVTAFVIQSLNDYHNRGYIEVIGAN